MTKVKYYAVYTKLNSLPEAIVRSRAWATRFVEDQQKIWVNAKFKIYKIEETDLKFKFMWL